jgi:hypothetical protein
MLFVLTMFLYATVANAASPKSDLITSQVNWLNTFQGGGALASGDAAGGSAAVNSATGDVIVSNTYGNKVLDINVQTGAVTVLADWGAGNYNVGAITLDSKNNLYIGGLYTNNVIKIPFVAGAYVAAPIPGTPAPANCTGTDTTECNFGSNLTNATNGYYFGITSMAFDAAGDFFFGLTNANTAPNAIFECTAACISTGTPAATLIYQEPTSATAAQLMVGGLAIDPWGNLFFTDSLYNGGKNESVSSNVNELPVSAGAGFGGVTTGFAAAPIVLYTETIATPASYDDELDAVAVDPVSGTVYFADQYNGVYAFPNSAGTVDPTKMYTVLTVGSKLLFLDAKDNLYGATYSTVISSGGADTAFQALINNVTIPGVIQVGDSASTSYNKTVQLGTPPVATVVTGSYVTVVDNVTTCATDPSLTIAVSGTNAAEFMAADTAIVPPATALLTPECSSTATGGASYPETVTFMPTAGGTQTATITATDSASNSGTSTATGVGLALIAQAIDFMQPTSPVNYGVGPITLDATGGASGNPVVFSVVSGPATVSGSTLTITGAGSVVVAANQAGDTTYSAAPQVEVTIVVDQAPQTIVFAPTTPVTFTATPITLTATGGASGNPVTFTLVSGPATLSGSSLTLTGLGSVVVDANQAGTANYAAAAQVQATIVVNPIGTVATPTLTPATGSTIYTNGADTVTIATTSAGATIYYTLTSGATGTTPTSGSTLYTSAGIPLTTVGTYTIEAIAVEADYTSSAVATATYTVSAIPPSFTMALAPAAISIQSGLSGSTTVSITPVGGFNSAVSFSCSGLPVGASCSFSPTTVTPNGTAVATTMLSVNTASNLAQVKHNSNPLFPGASLAVALCFLGWKKRRSVQLFVLLAISVIGITLFAGCGGSTFQQQPQPTTASVTVTATSGALTQTAVLTVTVN